METEAEKGRRQIIGGTSDPYRVADLFDVGIAASFQEVRLFAIHCKKRAGLALS